MKSYKVLIVDDDPEISDFIKFRLSRDAPHFSIAKVGTGWECLEYINDNHVDCILSDYQMPGMDGMELLKALRGGGSDVPFIFITGQGNEELAREAFKNGANDYFTKDIGFAHFTRIINSVGQSVRKRSAERSRHAAEAALVEEKNKLEAILAGIGDGISIQDPEFRVIYQNQGHKEFVGDHAGEHCYKAYNNKEKVCGGCPVAEMFKDGQVHTILKSSQTNKGYLHIEIKASPVKDSKGRVVAGIEAVRDVTERISAGEALRENERFLSSVFSSIQDGLTVLDKDLTIVRVNSTVEKWYHHAVPLVGKKCYEAFHGRTGPCEACPTVRTLKTGEHAVEVMHRHGRDREVVGWVELHSTPLVDVASGEVTGVIEYVRDITERRKTEEALRESEALFRSLVEESLVGVYIVQDGRFIYVNPRQAEIFGYTREEMLRLDRIEETVLPEDRALVQENIRKRVMGEAKSIHYPFRGLRKDKAAIEVEVYGTGTTFNGKPAVVGTLMDITERKRAEEALRESEEMFRRLAERSPNMIFINQKGKIVFANEKCEEAMGYTREEFYSPGFDFLTLIAPESIGQVKANFGRHMNGEEVSPYEYTLVTKGGGKTEAIISTRLIKYGGEPAILGIITDISGRKHAEDERSALYHMLTHDIKGPLSVIYGYGDELAEKLEEKDSAGMAHDIRKAARRISALIDDMLSLARMESGKSELLLGRVSLAALLRSAVEETAPAAARAGVDISVDADPAVPVLYADGGQLSRALGNLMLNAVHYNRPGGSVRVRASLHDGRRDRVVVEVSDTGEGIAPDDLPRVFDKYYRGKRNGRKAGTGLGLAIVKAVAEAHGGSVSASSLYGQGATFTMILPVKPGF